MDELKDITELFRSQKAANKYLKVAAPMVRYSKLEFRKLLRQNNVNLCFTPMMIADSFSRSEEARLNEFTTNMDDNPLIAQFAARSATEMLAATEFICPFVNGVDLNCGCPQSWAIGKGYGCALLRNPELLHDIVGTLRRNFPAKFSVSLKIRLLQEDVKSTIDICRQLEQCGATFLTIHGRTQWQKISHPLDITAMGEIKKSIKIPLIVNGNVKTLQDADNLYEQTQADGVMAARGLLANPGLYTGTEQTTLDCLQQWIDIAHAASDNISFQCFHHHLTFMWGKVMRRQSRVQFNNFSTKSQVFDFFEKNYNIRPQPLNNWTPNAVCNYVENYLKPNINPTETQTSEWNSSGDGKFFETYKETLHQGDSDSDLHFQNGSLFD